MNVIKLPISYQVQIYWKEEENQRQGMDQQMKSEHRQNST